MSKKKKSQLKVASLSGKECTVTLGKDGFLDLSALPKAPVEWLRSPERRGNFEAGITRVEIVLCQLRDEKRMTVVYWPSLTFNPDEGKHYFLTGGNFTMFHAKDEEELAYLIREVAAIKQAQHEMN